MIGFALCGAGAALVVTIFAWALCRAAAEGDRAMAAALTPDPTSLPLTDPSSAAIWAELDRLEEQP